MGNHISIILHELKQIYNGNMISHIKSGIQSYSILNY